MHFVSAELTSHSSNLIGLSIILLSYLSVATGRFPRVQFIYGNCFLFCFSKSTFDYIVLFLIFWLLNSGIIFSVMRLAYYGHLSSKIIDSERKKKSLKELWDAIAEDVMDKKILGVLPIKWFKSGIGRLSGGICISLAVGFLLSILLFFVFFFE